MTTLVETRAENWDRRRLPFHLEAPVAAPADTTSLRNWIRAQSINAARHAAAIRPFRLGEFGEGPHSPSEAHRQGVNRLIVTLRRPLIKASKQMRALSRDVSRRPTPASLAQYATLKEKAHSAARSAERVWDFYFELFGQRQSRLADLLLSVDRIALDCYQAVFMGLGAARSIPSPAPFAYTDTGFGPATFRRGVPLTALGKMANPFPLIKVPYHRLVNPWTLGAVPHEVSHNLQSDLGLWQVLPGKILERLRRAGIDPDTARIWARWHKEMFADACGLLLIGPTYVESLMGVVGRSPARTVGFNPSGVHPTPYLRVFINLELLRRIGFEREAASMARTWNCLYPRTLSRAIPSTVTSSFPLARKLTTEVICFTRYPELGGKALADVVRFQKKDQKFVEEAAARLAAGTNPGIVPERFFVAAARVALNRNLARPETISKNLYQALARR